MQKLVLLLILSLAIDCPAQNVTLKHKYYTSVFSKTLRFPVLCKYWVTKKMLSCKERIGRTEDFAPDPLLSVYTDLDKDYSGSGYDRGHNMDAYDNGCDIVGMHESFYYSNMTPQTPRLNRGIWKILEERGRDITLENDSVLVWSGSIPYKKDKKIGDLSIPAYCWKILYIKTLDSIEAYSFKNDNASVRSLSSYQVSLDSIRSLCGFKFKKK
jgi:endonuclease G